MPRRGSHPIHHSFCARPHKNQKPASHAHLKLGLPAFECLWTCNSCLGCVSEFSDLAMMASKLFAFLQPIPRREGAAQLCAPLHPWYPQCLCKCHMKPWVLRFVFFLCASALPDPYPRPQSGRQGYHRGNHGRGIREQEFNTSCWPPFLYPYTPTGMSNAVFPHFLTRPLCVLARLWSL